MVATNNAHAHNLLASVISSPRREPRALLECVTAKIRREPNPMSFAADFHRLINIENQNLERRLDAPQLAVGLSLHIDVRNTLKPFADSTPTLWDLQIRLLIEFLARAHRVRRRGHAKQRR